MTLSPKLDDAMLSRTRDQAAREIGPLTDFDPNENLDAGSERRHRRIDLIRRNDGYLRALAKERDEKHASGA